MTLAPLFTPLAKLLISLGIPVRGATEMLKRAYVAAAGERASDSRISMLTGLQRRDIARIRSEPEAPQRPDPLSRLVARWLAQNDGADLPRRGDGSFDALATEVFQDVHPRSLLDRLVEAGTAEDLGEAVRLKERFYRPSTGSEAAQDYLARNVGDHLAAAALNLEGAQFFERAVHYNNLAEDAVDELHSFYRREQAALLERLNIHAAALQHSAPGTQRFRAGGYFYSEDTT